MTRKITLYTTVAMLVLALGVAVMPASAQGSVPWRGQYYNNPTLSDPVALERIDGAIAFNWGLGSPAEGISPDNFSIRWAQDVFLPAGTYRFFALADDNIRVTFNFGAAIIDTFASQQIGQTISADVSVPVSGTYHIQVDYREVTGDAYAYVSYANAATNPQPNFSAPLPNPQLSAPWTSQYFANTTLSGSPAAILTEASPNHNWGTGQPVPSVGPDNWSARFTSVQNLQAGTYTAQLRMDDGARLFINGVLLIDQFTGATGQTHTATVYLPSGPSSFQIDFVEFSGSAFLDFALLGGTGTFLPTPTPPLGPNLPTFGVATVTAFRLNVRAEPSAQAPILTRVNLNESFPVTGRNTAGTWVQIIVNNQIGWVNSSYVRWPGVAEVPVVGTAPQQPPVPQPPASGVIVTATPYAVNLRSGPGTNFSRLGTIPAGQTASVIGRTTDATWWQVNFNGIVGWAAAQYARIQTGVNVNGIPVTG
jgi:uncharacterized protein YraI